MARLEIPGYRIERLIAEGGMASVYLAVQESLGRHVALKVLRKFDAPAQSERFFNEGRIIASLNHADVITIYDLGVVGDHHYIAMEYLDGGSLEQRMAQGMELEAALDTVVILGRLLDFLHRRGIVHRDLKPANILYHADGTLKLTDFGVAKLVEVDKNLTLDGTALGSPYYLSPEQAEGKDLDGRSDLYSLGVILYEMLAGGKPFDEPSYIETIIAHLTQPVPLLPERYEAYQPLLERLLAKDPAERFSSAGEMVGFLQALRAGQAPGEGAPSLLLLDRLSRAVRAPISDSPKKAIGVAAAVGLAILWVVWWMRPQGPGGPSAGAPPLDTSTPLSVESPSPPAHTEVAAAVSHEDTKEPRGTKGEVAAEQEVVEAFQESPREPTGAVTEAAQEDEALADGAPGAAGPAVLAEGPEPNSAEGKEDAGGATAGPTTTAAESTESGAVAAADGIRAEPESPLPVEQLLAMAHSALVKYRLTVPAGKSAYDYYSQVLERQPDHPEAVRGIDEIARVYAQLVRRELDRGNEQKARDYLRRGLEVRLDNETLLAQLREIEALESKRAQPQRKRSGFFQRLRAFFRSSGSPQ